MSPDNNNMQQGVILNLLQHIARRLWLTHLVERAAVAQAIAGGVAICLVLARWVHDRYIFLAVVLALLPLLLMVTALLGLARRQWRGRLTGRAVHTTWQTLPLHRRIVLVTAALLCVAAAVIFGLPVASHLKMWMIPSVVGAACLLAAFLTLPTVTHRAAAIFVDRQAGLQEKVTTALEWTHVGPAAPLEEGFRTPLLQSAAAACQQVHIARAGYARLDPRMYGIMLAAALVAGLLTTLQPLQASLRAPRPGLLATSKASDTLAEALAQLEKQHKDTTPAADKTVLEPLRQVAKTLRQSDEEVDKLEKELRVADQAREFKEMAERQDADQKTQQEMNRDEALGALAKAAEEMRQAAMAGDGGAASAEGQKAQALKDIEQAAAAAGDKLGAGKMGQDEKEKLKGALARAAGNAAKDPQLKQAFQGAAAAVDKNDGKGLAQNLTAAGTRMAEQTAQKSMTREELTRASQALDQAAREMGGGSQAEQQAAAQGAGQTGSQSGGGAGDDKPSAQNGSAGGEQNGGPQGGGHEGGGQQGGGQQSAGGQDGQEPSAGQQPGQSGGQQAGGQNGAGQGGQQPGGQAAGNGATASADNGGNGSTNLKQMGAPGSHNNPRQAGGVGEFVKIYGEKPIASQGATNKVLGKINPGGAVGSTDVQAMADKADQTLIEYSKEMPAARQAAESAIAKDKIPPQYRDFIREYFDEKK